MKLIKELNNELTILKIELKDAITTNWKDNILQKMNAIYTVLELYESEK